MADPSDSQLSPGTMLAHYRVETPLGSGAMGIVYRAHDTALERPVAVKVLHGHIAQEPELVRRFERESRAAARVNHPNLTHVYFVGHDDDDHRFFAMEHVPGESLLEFVESHGPLEWDDAVEVLIQSARGLRAAQAAGVIHRDVKPSNIMLLPDRTVKVTDFGLSKSLSADVDATGAGRIMGTPRYMSPEQCRGEPTDGRTDAYSLGLTGYYLLAGKHAYDGESIGKVINDQINSPLPSVAEVAPDFPASAQRALDRLCEKNPTDRPQSMDEVIAILEASRPRELDLAPLAARGAALAVDLFLFAITLGAIETAVTLVAGFYKSPLLQWFEVLLRVVILAGLQIGMEWKWAGSPGKLAFRLRVVGEDGGPPALLALAWRFLVRFPAVAMLVVPPGWPLVHFSIIGLQVVALTAGAVCHFVLGNRTMSDVLTRTRVIHHVTETERIAG